MATLADISCKIELSPEVKEELDKLNTKADRLIELLEQIASPAEVKIVGRDLVKAISTVDYRNARAL